MFLNTRYSRNATGYYYDLMNHCLCLLPQENICRGLGIFLHIYQYAVFFRWLAFCRSVLLTKQSVNTQYRPAIRAMKGLVSNLLDYHTTGGRKNWHSVVPQYSLAQDIDTGVCIMYEITTLLLKSTIWCKTSFFSCITGEFGDGFPVYES